MISEPHVTLQGLEELPTISSPTLWGRIKEGAERAKLTGRNRRALFTLPQAGGEVASYSSYITGGMWVDLLASRRGNQMLSLPRNGISRSGRENKEIFPAN